MPTVFGDLDETYEFFRGEDKLIDLTVRDAAGVAVDISTWTMGLEVRLRTTNPTALITKATGGSGLAFTSNGTNGIIRATFASDDTKDLGPGSYRYALARTTDGAWDVVKAGKLVLLAAAVHA